MTTPQTTPSSSPQTTPIKVPHDKIAQRAYEKWVKRGRPNGSNEQDWLEAEAELKVEIARGAGSLSQPTGGLSQPNRR
jgi:hypothetical protein